MSLASDQPDEVLLAMRMRGPIVVIALLALAGCGDNEARMILHVKGELATARYVDVVLASPNVVRRTQRTGDQDESTGIAEREQVWYVAQRATIETIDLDEQPASDRDRDRELVLQVASDPGARFLPIVIARDAQKAIVGMGVFEPKSLFDDDDRSKYIENSNDGVRVYVVDLEPIEPAPTTPPARQPVETVLDAVCFDPMTQAARTSGLVWRRAEGQQLRVLLPETLEESSAEKLLDRPDLDCDQHVAGIVGADDLDVSAAADCDDLAGAVHTGKRELCNGHDDDCDDRLTGVSVGGACPAPVCPNNLASTLPKGVCDESAPALGGSGTCLTAECGSCMLDTQQGFGINEISYCAGSAVMSMDRCDAAGCEVTLIDAVAPPGYTLEISAVNEATPSRVGLYGTVMIGQAFNADAAINLHITPPAAQAIGSEARGHLTLHVRSLEPGAPPSARTVTFGPGEPDGVACDASVPLSCTFQ